MAEADKDGRMAKWVSDQLTCLGIELNESMREARVILDGMLARLEADGWTWPPNTCTTRHCICRRGHPNGHVIADTRSDGTPWEDDQP